MKKLFPYFKPYKWQTLLGPLFKLSEAIFELTVPLIVAKIVDNGLGTLIDGKYPNADTAYIVRMCIVLGVFGLVGLCCAVVAQFFAARVATGVAADVRSSLFEKLQSLSYADLDRLGTSTMLTRMTGDVNQLQSGIQMFLRLFLRSPFIVFGAMIMAFLVDAKSALVFVAAIPVLALVVAGIMFVTMPLYKRSQSHLDEVTLSTRENLTGARVIRAFCKEEDEIREFKARNQRLTKSREFAGMIGALTNPLTYVLINAAVILLLWTGAIRVDGGSLTQGGVIALYNLMSQILVELIKLANLIVTVSKAAACASRIENVLETENSLELLPETEMRSAAGDQAFIVFDHVDMKYKGGGDNALTDIHFCAARGERIGVIGGTGSGKTTLVNLLPHFYDVTGGQVCVDGKDVRAYPPEELRKKIGVVPQKAVLFKGTIGENLRWGNSLATDEELMAAARLAQADKIIEGKGGLDAPVEQGGKNFSGGQKQRLTIARALVRRPEILILDDSSSALDYATDAALRRALASLDYKPTVFVVSQRTSAMNGADKIIVLDEGRAVGIGTHEELLDTCAVYKEIYDSQYKDAGEPTDNINADNINADNTNADNINADNMNKEGAV